MEHGVKVYQSVALGHQPALGILGNWFALIPLHLWLNGICFALVVPFLVSTSKAWLQARRRLSTVATE